MDAQVDVSNNKLLKLEFRRQWKEVFGKYQTLLNPNEFGDVKPLKIGIGLEMVLGLPEVKRFVVNAVLKQHVSSNRYLRALAIGGARYGLDGESCGEVSPFHQTHAIKEIRRRMEKKTAPGESS